MRQRTRAQKKFFDENVTPQQKESSVEVDNSAQTKKAAVVVTGDEFGGYSDIEELRDKAIQYYKDSLQGTSVENKLLGKIDIDENGLIGFTTSGRKKLQSTAREDRKLLAIKYLPELLKTAFNVRTVESNKEKHIKDSFIYMENDIDVNGNISPVHITLVRRNNGDIQFYNFNFMENEKHAGKPARPESSKEALGTLPVSVSLGDSVSQSENEGKENSQSVQLKEKNSGRNYTS